MKYFIFIVILIFNFNAAHAEDKRIKFVGSIGGSSGGDRLYSGAYVDGDTFEVKAGGGVFVNAGVAYSFDPEIEIQTTIGFHDDGPLLSDGSVNFTRYPAEAIVFYKFIDNFKIGIGMRKSLGSNTKISGRAAELLGGDTGDSFDSSLGGVIEFQYVFDKKIGAKDQYALSMRYVSEKYILKGTNVKLNGNHIGFGINYYR